MTAQVDTCRAGGYHLHSYRFWTQAEIAVTLQKCGISELLSRATWLGAIMHIMIEWGSL